LYVSLSIDLHNWNSIARAGNVMKLFVFINRNYSNKYIVMHFKRKKVKYIQATHKSPADKSPNKHTSNKYRHTHLSLDFPYHCLF